MDDIFGLDLLSVGNAAVICGNEHYGGMRRRLADMGFTEGTDIRCVGANPCGDMRAYFVKGSVVALRQTDACRVYVRGSEGGKDATLRQGK